ncbi:hypothetical protein GA0070606_4418 [Micromonospora citrea]|uniref:Uncharacterized protein n=1 Tax=Micromonospora citrea TaxID=47855 RepID=A0A1C6VKI4_9ACTN|nr:hypothetical protein [Micromonospora citrea]SCL66831.1 hypothetical protein GA0070606_4418 [Micromonospora citrea]
MSMENLNPRGHDHMVRATEEARRRSAAARLFDIRRVIGGLFTVYGVIVTLVGVFDGATAVEKAQGVRINLWAGLGMLAFGVLMLLWQWRNPAQPPESPAPSSEPPGEGR